MSTLHTINKSPASRLLDDCLAVCSPGDEILFIEDGVYYCVQPGALERIGSDVTTMGLREDLQARGLLDRLAEQVAVVSMRRFVELSCSHTRTVSWF